jgi:hypothetical protein
MTTTETTFSTYDSGKQAQIVHDLMDLFKSNQRGYGLGEFEGAKFNEDKNKWIPGHVRWTWGHTGSDEWRNHLLGVRLLGQGVLCDDNKVWYACLDIDIYDIDYAEEMQRIRRSKLPLVVTRTKSGGLRIIVLFNEAIEADLVVSRMRRVAASLGYSGCEIFPKQTTLIVEKDDCPSWIYVPFGGTHDIFAEQGCMTDNGNLMELSDAVMHMKDMRITKGKFMEMFAEEEAAKTNGKTNGRKHPKGAWVQEESYEVTLNTMFCDGPPCMWTIVHEKCRGMQNNFLLNVLSFLKRKYPENWDKALEWVNYNVLQPVGDRERLHEMITRMRNQEYEYRCHDQPICAHCNPHACRRMPFGVGTSSNGIDHFELGITIIERVPAIYIVNFGDTRIEMSSSDLNNQPKYRERCMDHGILPPASRPKVDWEKMVMLGIESAPRIPPSHIMRTNAAEFEFLSQWLSITVPTFMRVGEKGKEDTVRVKMEEKRIYFKPKKLMRFCRQQSFNETAMRSFIDHKCQSHKEDGVGIREWYRWTYSISFDMIDEDDLETWLAADTDKGDGNGQGDGRTDR